MMASISLPRLEGLAEAGGICISKTAFDQIESKLPYEYEYLGDHTVKNIARPVGAYRVSMEPGVTVTGKPKKEKRSQVWRGPILIGICGVLVLAVTVGIWQFYMRRPPLEPASSEKMVNAIPYKSSIAVLPFTNLSGEPDQQYFSAGLTQEIITALSKVYNISVIDQNSTITDERRSLDDSQVEKNLGGRYVLQGSVQKAGDRVRIMAQLIETLTGHHLWAERYDRDLKEVFNLQDEITKEIITALQVKLTMGEDARLLGRGTDNLDVYLKLLRAREFIAEATIEGNVFARQLAEEAIALDPEYSEGYRMLGVNFARIRP